MRDWDTDHFDMQWAAPRNDGGSRITGYELEARLWREPAWFKAGEVRMMMMMMIMMMMMRFMLMMIVMMMMVVIMIMMIMTI